ncbi:putative carbonate dehydratase [Aspergillus clavatus NRRL 1]|uniref:Carbonic anhydrase n=1 Tax=Aspergillus clavatus (strain ATCC 1007 / CBS 513.65 / DSM 816 / NCTC 3887 / NRRL 1 / QM 1276 / 107) TaxID=344612 RepID=A1CDV7_ASPCL|nr:carbonate dehydratase, putative [Aspergillus clavatus NRRL 1]EAW12034.1 carbonate dehydratase, putative [Aspergillus clavatus NRRL 1]
MTRQSCAYERRPLNTSSLPWRRQPGQQILWIGCSDSGCNEPENLGASRDEVFEYRNLGNILVDDLSWNTTLRYAIASLKIRDIVICGHYGCEIVKSTPNTGLSGPWSSILDRLRSTYHSTLDGVSEKEQNRTLVELNVLEQKRAMSRVPEIAEAVEQSDLKIHSVVHDAAARSGYQLIEPDR